MSASIAPEVWERRLARENLQPLDQPEATGYRRSRSPLFGLSKRGHSETLDHIVESTLAPPGQVLKEHTDAAELWLAWAREVFSSHRFGGRRQRSVWRLYAEGQTLTEIQEKLRVSRRSVTLAIARVERTAPPAPVENPWRRSGREDTKDGQILALLRSLLARYQQEEPMPPVPRKKVRYTRITMRKGEYFRIPGNPRDKDMILDVEGTPHAGGIDLEIDTNTITLPWSRIAMAEHAREAAAGE